MTDPQAPEWHDLSSWQCPNCGFRHEPSPREKRLAPVVVSDERIDQFVLDILRAGRDYAGIDRQKRQREIVRCLLASAAPAKGDDHE